jgi:hypothetical protein
MCVRVRYTSAAPYVPYDPAERCICLPSSLPEELTLTVVRAILGEMAIEQPSAGATCFCGAPVRFLPRVPQQQRRSEQVSHHGA